MQLTFHITVHIVKKTKELNDEDFGITIKKGPDSTIYVKANGDFYETLFHEFVHATQELIGNQFDDHELCFLAEDFIRKYLRERKNT